MTDKPTLTRLSLAAILLRNNGYDDVAKFLMAKEQRERKGKRQPKEKMMDVATRYGTKAKRGSRGRIRLEGHEIEEIGG